jgi:hypothetical protein
MRITKCDACHKIIKKEPLSAGVGSFGTCEFCQKCGEPIVKLLKKYNLIDSYDLEKLGQA